MFITKNKLKELIEKERREWSRQSATRTKTPVFGAGLTK